MNSLEFIEKAINTTKKQLVKYPLSKEQSDPNYKHKEADIQYIHNKYYTEQLQTLQQIKIKLEEYEKLKDKETPKKTKTKMNEHCYVDRHCPICETLVYSFDNYCGKCGQRIRSDE